MHNEQRNSRNLQRLRSYPRRVTHGQQQGAVIGERGIIDDGKEKTINLYNILYDGSTVVRHGKGVKVVGPYQLDYSCVFFRV